MDKFRWTIVGIAVIIVIAVVAALSLIIMPGAAPQANARMANSYSGMVPAGELLRVPVTGIYPGGSSAGLNPDMKNPLANDPDAVARGAKDFDAFNCSGCHMAHAGGGMGPALSDAAWIYRSSDANIYLDIAAVWGPLGGYFAKGSPVALRVTPITDTRRFAPLEFQFAIAMGVRKGDTALRDRLDAVIAREQPAIRNILRSYGVPMVALKGASHG
jgi:hypothetical protein